MLFKVTNSVDGESDPMFFEADDLDAAKKKFSEQMGDMPASMLRWEKVTKLPKGVEAL